MHAMDYYLAIIKTEILALATTRMKLEGMMLSERSQSRKTAYYMIPFIRNIQKR